MDDRDPDELYHEQKIPLYYNGGVSDPRVQYTYYHAHEMKPICLFGINITSSVFWAYVVILVITAVVLVYFWFQSNYPGNLKVPAGAPTGATLLASWIIAFLVFIWVGYNGYILAAPDYRHQNLLNIALALNIIIGVFWAILFFYSLRPNEAFWLIIIEIIVCIWWIFLIWNIDKLSAFFLFIHLIFLFYFAYINYQFILVNPQ